MPRRKTTKASPTAKPTNGKLVRLVWDSADNLPTLYANHLIISHGAESEFHIVFGHLTPPLALAEEDIPDRFVIKPVAKIVVTPQTMRKIIDAMAKNLERFEAKNKGGK